MQSQILGKGQNEILARPQCASRCAGPPAVTGGQIPVAGAPTCCQLSLRAFADALAKRCLPANACTCTRQSSCPCSINITCASPRNMQAYVLPDISPAPEVVTWPRECQSIIITCASDSTAQWRDQPAKIGDVKRMNIGTGQQDVIQCPCCFGLPALCHVQGQLLDIRRPCLHGVRRMSSHASALWHSMPSRWRGRISCAPCMASFARLRIKNYT